jgi:hypothetical protein
LVTHSDELCAVIESHVISTARRHASANATTFVQNDTLPTSSSELSCERDAGNAGADDENVGVQGEEPVYLDSKLPSFIYIDEVFMSTRFVRIIASVLLVSFVMIGCSSTTLITSDPPGAKLSINGVSVGKTPYTHSDTRIVGSTLMIKLEKDGYEPLNTMISRDERVDVGAIIGGLFVLVPFLWTMQYNPQHSYELSPLKK